MHKGQDTETLEKRQIWRHREPNWVNDVVELNQWRGGPADDKNDDDKAHHLRHLDVEFVDGRVRLDYRVGLPEPRSHSVEDDAVQAHEDSQWNEDIQDIQVDHARKVWERVAVIETKYVYSLKE